VTQLSHVPVRLAKERQQHHSQSSTASFPGDEEIDEFLRCPRLQLLCDIPLQHALTLSHPPGTHW
jgi:hypothetical protein